MTRTNETISREEFIQLTQDLECGQDLLDELNSWESGESCLTVEYSVDSLGRIDSESSPSPLAMTKLIEEIKNESTLCNTLVFDHEGSRLVFRETHDGYGNRGAFFVAQVRPGDTIESLEAEKWNEHTNAFEALFNGHGTRALLDWTPAVADDFVSKHWV